MCSHIFMKISVLFPENGTEMLKTALFRNLRGRPAIVLDQSIYPDLLQKLRGSILGREHSSKFYEGLLCSCCVTLVTNQRTDQQMDTD